MYMTWEARVVQLSNNSWFLRLNLTIIYAKNPLEFGSNKDGIIFFFHQAVTSRAALSSKMLTTTVIEIYINQKKIWNI